MSQNGENKTAWQRFLPDGPIAILPVSQLFVYFFSHSLFALCPLTLGFYVNFVQVTYSRNSIRHSASSFTLTVSVFVSISVPLYFHTFSPNELPDFTDDILVLSFLNFAFCFLQWTYSRPILGTWLSVLMCR
jgi:hypothetical protein